MDDWMTALEIVVARTKHQRYRALCAPGHPDHPAWRARVRALAAAPGPPPPAAGLPVAESLALTRRMKGCPHRSVDAGCGCNGGRCAARGGAIVSHLDCFSCLRSQTGAGPVVSA
jgi:hypothetical protein